MTTVLCIHGQEPAQNLQFSAFGTIGIASLDTHKVGYHRDNSQPMLYALADKPRFDMDSRYGVQLSAKLSDTFLATFQAVSKLRYDGTYKPDVTLACLAWNPVSSLQLRAGIMTQDTMSNGECMDIGYTYLWVRPPVDVYGPNNITRLKGVDAAHTFSLGGVASVQLRGYFGDTLDSVPAGGLSGPWDLSGSRVWGLASKVQVGSFKGRVSVNRSVLSRDLPQPVGELQDAFRYFSGLLNDPRLAGTADALSLKGVAVRAFQAGGVWERGPWQVQGAYQESHSDSFMFPEGRSGFLSLGYRVGSLVPYATFARAITRGTVRPEVGALGSLPPQFGPLVPVGQEMVASLTRLSRSRVTDQHTLSAGLRWDFAANADLKFQVDQVRAHSAQGGMVDLNPWNPTGWNGHATVFTVTLDFVFGGGR